jgi:hypothetical protein
MPFLTLLNPLPNEPRQTRGLGLLNAEDWDMVGAEKDRDVSLSTKLLQWNWTIEQIQSWFLCIGSFMVYCFDTLFLSRDQYWRFGLLHLRRSSLEQVENVFPTPFIASYRRVQMIDCFISCFKTDSQSRMARRMLRLFEAIANDVLEGIALLRAS